MEKILGPGIVVGVVLFLLWCLWVTNPKKPERMRKLRESLGVDIQPRYEAKREEKER